MKPVTRIKLAPPSPVASIRRLKMLKARQLKAVSL
jgi:hypothetical protein